jgi:hypothetical protein
MTDGVQEALDAGLPLISTFTSVMRPESATAAHEVFRRLAPRHAASSLPAAADVPSMIAGLRARFQILADATRIFVADDGSEPAPDFSTHAVNVHVAAVLGFAVDLLSE